MHGGRGETLNLERPIEINRGGAWRDKWVPGEVVGLYFDMCNNLKFYVRLTDDRYKYYGINEDGVIEVYAWKKGIDWRYADEEQK